MMKKSLLTASVIGAISAAVSGIASADNMFYAANSSSTYCKPGFYAGVQGGRSDTFYKTNDIFSAAALGGGSLAGSISPFSSAGLPSVVLDESSDPFYLDGTPVTSVSNTGGALTNQHIDDIGIGGRIYAGYQFNPYFALETGYTQYAKTSFNTNQSVNITQTTSAPYREPEDENAEATVTQTQNFDGSNYYAGDVTEHAVDLVAKATLPLQAGFGVYADAGLAFVQANRYINSFSSNGTLSTTTTFDEDDDPAVSSTTTSSVSNSSVNTVFDKTYQAVRPVVGAGIDYTLPGTNVDISVFYNRLFGNNDNGVGIPDASLWGLGAGYKFA